MVVCWQRLDAAHAPPVARPAPQLILARLRRGWLSARRVVALRDRVPSRHPREREEEHLVTEDWRRRWERMQPKARHRLARVREGGPGAARTVACVGISVVELAALAGARKRRRERGQVDVDPASGEAHELVRPVAQRRRAELLEPHTVGHVEVVADGVRLLDRHPLRELAAEAAEDRRAAEECASVRDLVRQAVRVAAQLLVAVREEEHHLPMRQLDHVPHVAHVVQAADLARPAVDGERNVAGCLERGAQRARELHGNEHRGARRRGQQRLQRRQVQRRLPAGGHVARGRSPALGDDERRAATAARRHASRGRRGTLRDGDSPEGDAPSARGERGEEHIVALVRRRASVPALQSRRPRGLVHSKGLAARALARHEGAEDHLRVGGDEALGVGSPRRGRARRWCRVRRGRRDGDAVDHHLHDARLCGLLRRRLDRDGLGARERRRRGGPLGLRRRRCGHAAFRRAGCGLAGELREEERGAARRGQQVARRQDQQEVSPRVQLADSVEADGSRQAAPVHAEHTAARARVSLGLGTCADAVQRGEQRSLPARPPIGLDLARPAEQRVGRRHVRQASGGGLEAAVVRVQRALPRSRGQPPIDGDQRGHGQRRMCHCKEQGERGQVEAWQQDGLRAMCEQRAPLVEELPALGHLAQRVEERAGATPRPFATQQQASEVRRISVALPSEEGLALQLGLHCAEQLAGQLGQRALFRRERGSRVGLEPNSA